MVMHGTCSTMTVFGNLKPKRRHWNGANRLKGRMGNRQGYRHKALRMAGRNS